MTYWALNAVFLGVVAVIALAVIVARRAPSWRAVALAAIPLLLLTAIFDNVLVATGIVGYDEALISGARLGVAPLEDFAYALAALVLLPALWSLLTPRALPESPNALAIPTALDDSGSARREGEP